MFINTSNRLIKFYTSNKNSIDTLLLLVQILAIAIALLGLLAILGWALAISQAIAWLNKLVEDSLEPQRLLMPSIDTSDNLPNDMPNTPNTDEILAEWQAIAAKITPLVETGFEIDVVKAIAPQEGNTSPLQALSIRQLKRMARDRKVSKYSNLTKAELILALS
jgi:Rho termination factor, N-terminal domain